MRTGNNERFLRLWYEPNFRKIGFGYSSAKDANGHGAKWIPYNKGGEFRKWYGNLDYIVNWEDNGFEIKENTRKVYPQLGENLGWKISNEQYYFKEGISWTVVTSKVCFRRYYQGNIFSNSGQSVIASDSNLLDYLTGALNSCVSEVALNILSPTLGFESGYVNKVPIVISNQEIVQNIVNANIILGKSDWDSYETSWDFQRHPLLRPVFRLSDAYTAWKSECEQRFLQLKANEEELNCIFIDIYGLQGELTPEVADKDVTVHRVFDTKDDVPESMQGSSYVRTKRDEIVSLLSYAVGCMFGRYSLDKQGLVFAGGDFDSVYWKFKGQAALNEQGDPIEGGYAGISLANYHYPRFHNAENWEDATLLSYEPDVDGVIPITDEEYLEDDIVSRLCDWLKAVYGSDTLEENLDFIAGALSGKGNSSREIIRNYFLKDFFKDHCKTYQKRPIYWLFDSGKQNGFKALIYLHRYMPDTIGNLRVDYLHKMQRVYESEINRMQDMIDHSTNAREVAASTKRKEKLQKQLKECRDYDEMIAHLALSRIELDLDDGVKVNYEKIQTASDGKKYSVLAKI